MTTPLSRTALLSAERRLLEDQLDRIRRDLTRQHGALDPDFAEQAVQRENDEVLDRLEVAVSRSLKQVVHALDRSERGLGAVCEVCADRIDPERLRVMPQATLCVDCALADAQPRSHAVGFSHQRT